MNAGMNMRMKKIFETDGKTFILPFDHGISSGVVEGLEDVGRIVEIANKYADAIMVRPGLMKTISKTLNNDVGIILCLTGRLYKGVDHVKINSVIEAIRNGADAICVEYKVGSERDLENASLASELIEMAHYYNIPALVTTYAQPDYIEMVGVRAYVDVCRIAEEIGADFVKTNLPNNKDIVQQCVRSTSIPIIIAGGEKNQENIMEKSMQMINWGVKGVAIGRNIWGIQYPEEVAKKIRMVIHNEI